MRDLVWSFAAALVIVSVLIYGAGFSLFASVLLAPGMLLATHIVPHSAWDGLHISDTGESVQVGKISPWRYVYVVTLVGFNAVTFSLPVLFVIRRFKRRRAI